MANWSNYKITNVGLSLIAEAQAQGLTLTFTNLKTSSHDYSSATLETLTDLEDIEQTFALTEKTNINNKVRLTANLNNNLLVNGYQFYTYGLYANTGSSDVLVFVASCSDPDDVPSSNESAWQTIINSYLTISNEVNVTINIDLSANATQQYVQDYVNGKLDSRIKLTIPADDTTNYTTKQDKDGVDFYSIRFTVTGMRDTFNGTQPLTPTMVDPEDSDFSIAEWEEIRDTYFPMIMAAWGRTGGYVDIYLYELPDTDFDVYLYGV